MNPTTPELSSEGQTDLEQRVRQGDRAAEAELAAYFGSRLLAMFIARTRDRELARDLSQDTLIVVLQQVRRGAVREPEKLSAFVHAIARNTLNSHFRSRGRTPREEPLLHDVAAQLPDYAEEEQRERLLREALDQLDDIDRKILASSLADGAKPGRIGTMLGLSSEVIRQRKSRALKKITEYIKQAVTNPRVKPTSYRPPYDL